MTCSGPYFLAIVTGKRPLAISSFNNIKNLTFQRKFSFKFSRKSLYWIFTEVRDLQLPTLQKELLRVIFPHNVSYTYKKV